MGQEGRGEGAKEKEGAGRETGKEEGGKENVDRPHTSFSLKFALVFHKNWTNVLNLLL